MGIVDTSSDALLEILRTRVSQAIASECGREFARDTVTQTFRLLGANVVPYSDRRTTSLILGRSFPDPTLTAGYCTIASVTEDGTVLDPEDYEIDPTSGLLYRLASGCRFFWIAANVEVIFTAGYVLPDDGNATLPAEISGAAVELIRAAKFNATRDPALRSEDILSGLYSYTLFDPMKADTALPASVSDVLDKYRNRTIG